MNRSKVVVFAQYVIVVGNRKFKALNQTSICPSVKVSAECSVPVTGEVDYFILNEVFPEFIDATFIQISRSDADCYMVFSGTGYEFRNPF